MKRIFPFVLLDLGILFAMGLLIWLGMSLWSTIKRESLRVPEGCPRVWVEAEYSWHGYVGMKTKGGQLDDALLGRSLWWGADWVQYVQKSVADGKVYLFDERNQLERNSRAGDQLEPIPLREAPGAEVQGARRLKPREEVPVSLFLRQGEAGLWRICRAEARLSSEDVAREGEIRMPGVLKMGWGMDAKRQGDKLLPVLHYTLVPGHSPTITYETSLRELKQLRRWNRTKTGLVFTMELALPEEGEPVPTEVRINGLPFDEAMKYIRRDEFPPKTEEVQTCRM